MRSILGIVEQAHFRKVVLGKLTYTQLINSCVWNNRMDMAWKYFEDMEIRTDFGGADLVVYNIMLKGIGGSIEESFGWLKKMDEKGIK